MKVTFLPMIVNVLGRMISFSIEHKSLKILSISKSASVSDLLENMFCFLGIEYDRPKLASTRRSTSMTITDLERRDVTCSGVHSLVEKAQE